MTLLHSDNAIFREIIMWVASLITYWFLVHTKTHMAYLLSYPTLIQLISSKQLFHLHLVATLRHYSTISTLSRVNEIKFEKIIKETKIYILTLKLTNRFPTEFPSASFQFDLLPLFVESLIPIQMGISFPVILITGQIIVRNLSASPLLFGRGSWAFSVLHSSIAAFCPFRPM